MKGYLEYKFLILRYHGNHVSGLKLVLRHGNKLIILIRVHFQETTYNLLALGDIT